ncbi:MAG: phospho-sugar mutase [Nitrospirota bacterium]
MEEISLLNEAKQKGEICEKAFINIMKWLKNEEYKEYRNEILQSIQHGKFKELNDSFFTIIPFGTGGRRGQMGVGTNRINFRTIGESAQGLAEYIVKLNPKLKSKGIVIAYDTRNYSKEFAEESAIVLAGNGIKAYLFDGFRPAPELSFAVRELGTAAGIVISASHNPPSDNGLKVYWENGGQILPPHDKNVIDEVNKVTQIKKMKLEEAKQKGLLEYVGEDLDKKYWAKLAGLSLVPDRGVKIVYSPLHGTGSTFIVPVLQQLGFTDLHLVEEQMTPDGNFSQIKNNKPNPEEPEALELVIQKAKELEADLAIASDPDGDRLGVAVKKEDEWIILTGNQVGALLTHFILTQLKDKLPQKGVIAKTIVTTDLIDAIAKKFKVEVKGNLLVGFKYIGQVINNLAQDEEFIFGTEESLGYLKGTFVRDKDAATAAILMAELASWLKTRGSFIYEQLNEIYKEYGYYKESLTDIFLRGMEGKDKMDRIMKELRSNPPLEIGGLKTVAVIDRLSGEEIDPVTKTKIRDVEGTKGDVLIFSLSEDRTTRLTFRPSGTEPKIKIYTATKVNVNKKINNEELEQIKTDADEIIDRIEKDMKEIAMRIVGE